jgi:hypothetical protein
MNPNPSGIDLGKAAWRKATRSNGQNACVEIADLGEHVGVRDSKDPTGPVLVVSRAQFAAFVASLTA